ncbi:MAG: hypothetical protein HFH06_08830 [Lachnospiraceae bacterium]|nr:hypothetical protein [Lachnospiraceae bacterium]
MERLSKVHICEMQLNSLLDVGDVRNNYMVTTDTYESIFIKNIYEWKDYFEETAVYEPFTSFLPTYSSMNDKQRRFYFYWRHQYRLGNYIKTDTAYIYVLVYELLEGIGWKEEIDGFYELKRIWEKFRECSDSLALDLELWIYDFVIDNKLEQEISADLYGIIMHSKNNLLVNVYLEYIKNDTNAELTWDTLKNFFLYDCSKESIFQGSKKGDYQDIIIMIMDRINRYYHCKYQKSVFDYYQKSGKRTEKHFVYANAVKSKNKYYYLEYTPYIENLELKGFLTGILKYSINMLRKVYGYRGRLHVETIETSYVSIIKECIESQEQPEYAKIELTAVDDSELERMRAEAQDIIELLEVKEKEEEVFEIAEEANKEIENVKSALSDLGSGVEIMETDDSISQFLSELNECQKKIIRILVEATEGISRLRLLEREYNLMIDSAIDEINEHFYAFFDDILIDMQGETAYICDEYEHILIEKLEIKKV